MLLFIETFLIRKRHNYAQQHNLKLFPNSVPGWIFLFSSPHLNSCCCCIGSSRRQPKGSAEVREVEKDLLRAPTMQNDIATSPSIYHSCDLLVFKKRLRKCELENLETLCNKYKYNRVMVSGCYFFKTIYSLSCIFYIFASANDTSSTNLQKNYNTFDDQINSNYHTRIIK